VGAGPWWPEGHVAQHLGRGLRVTQGGRVVVGIGRGERIQPQQPAGQWYRVEPVSGHGPIVLTGPRPRSPVEGCPSGAAGQLGRRATAKTRRNGSTVPYGCAG